VLFEEATNVIEQSNAGRSSVFRESTDVGTTQDQSLEMTIDHGKIDEQVLREFLLKSDQAYDIQMPWDHQAQADIFRTTNDGAEVDMGIHFEEAQTQLNDMDRAATIDHSATLTLAHTTSVPLNLDFMNMGLTGQRYEDEEKEAVEQSLTAWRQATAPTMSRSLIDVTTYLIDYWFRDVCPMWSAFDSNQNPNRILMSRIWTDSKAVLHSIKTMSATCLLPTLPHLRSEANTSARLAVKAIEEDLSELKLDCHEPKKKVPLDLFIALLCVGTTMCWLDTNLLGLAYWKEAHRLLNYYNDIYWLLDEEEQQKLTFFDNSCVYWDLLASVVSNEGVDTLSAAQETRVSSIFGCQTSLVKPHPWTGIAYTQQRLLSRTIALCRRHRMRIRNQLKTGNSDPQPNIKDLMDAYMISNELETMDQPSPQNVLDMGDRLSSPSHFTTLVSAFRLASLLQLHQTFQLDVSSYSNTRAQRHFVLKLALELVKILKDIPVWSNTRCTQPILYITAASGLRFETTKDAGMLTPEVLEVHRARKFILDRLAALERSLPPKPIVVAQKLVQRIWQKYETEKGDAMDVHWIDVMIDGRLSTLFG
jgi:hypothetical protein